MQKVSVLIWENTSFPSCYFLFSHWLGSTTHYNNYSPFSISLLALFMLRLSGSLMMAILYLGITIFKNLILCYSLWVQLSLHGLDHIIFSVLAYVLRRYWQMKLWWQVYYRFSNLSLLREPMMLISGFFFLFVACIIYMHADLTISKSSPSYLAKLQWDEVS